MTRKPRKTSPQSGTRERFNWGFWDGLTDRDAAQRSKPAWWSSAKRDAGHFDPVYSAGYAAGAWWKGAKPDTSDAAWLSYSS